MRRLFVVASLIGLFHGWIGWYAVLLGALLAFAAGAIVALAMMAIGRVTANSRLPFGRFILAGAIAAILIARP